LVLARALALLDFANMLLLGGVPKEVRHVFFGASLHALRNKDGGLRPIVVGLTLHRLVSKVANKWGSVRMVADLVPRQLGVGVRGGAEAGVHATRAFLDSAATGHALLKLDFTNAFNTVRRDAFIEEVAQKLPELLVYVSASYESTSFV